MRRWWVAEAWSDFVATLLAEHWGAIRDLNALAKTHPSFGKFVLRHIDETMSLDQSRPLPAAPDAADVA
jgi:hypothetical protein